jgi:hypothetical protein
MLKTLSFALALALLSQGAAADTLNKACFLTKWHICKSGGYQSPPTIQQAGPTYPDTSRAFSAWGVGHMPKTMKA